MNRVLVAKDLALGTDQSALADGQMCLLVETPVGTLKYWQTGDAVERFAIVCYGATTGLISTPYLEKNAKNKILRKAVPTAAVNNAWTATATALADTTYGSSPNDEWLLTVNLYGGRDIFSPENQARTYVVRGQYASATLLYAALATEINSSTSNNGDVTATSSSGGVVITTGTAYANASMQVGFRHEPYLSTTVPQAATAAETTALVLANGDVADLIREFNYAKPSLGSFYTTDIDIPKMPTPTVSGTFNKLYLYIQNKHHTTDMQAHGNEVYTETLIYYPSTATTNYTNLIAALEEILGTTFIATTLS